MRNFRYNWFQPNIDPISKALAHLVGTPACGLEIGSFEGVSTCWFFENILTHADAKLTCVDHFKGGSDQQSFDISKLQEVFLANTAEFASKREVLVDDCWNVWPRLAPDSYNFVFVDGSHEKWDVLNDAVQAYRVTKPGGLIMFDDYHWRPDLSSRPAVAIDCFLTCFETKVHVIEKGHCVIVKRL